MAITEDGRITLVKGAAGASREELDLSSISTGGRLDFYDDAAVYHGGFRSNYSPTQTVAYSTMRAIFDDDAAAQQATAIIWNSAQEGRFWGSFATDPRSWVGAVTLGTIDAGHRGLKKVFSDNDLMGRIKDRFLPSTKTEVYIDDWIGP